MTHKTLPQRLDAIAERTGIPALVARPRRRPLRWLPVVVLVLATVGIGMLLFAGSRHYWVGEGLVMAAFSASAWMPLKGPVKPWGAVAERVDEHDQMVRKNAYLAALPFILVWAMIALSGLPALAIAAGWPMERLAASGFPCAFFAMILWNTVPTLHASWKWREDGED